MSRSAVYRTTRNHNIPYGVDVDKTVVHWKYDSVEHTVPTEDNQPEDDQKPRKFAVRTWVIDENYTPVEDGDNDATVTFKVRQQRVVPVVESEPGDLTASDIRGAVGGEVIPGIASDTYGPDANGIASNDSTPAPGINPTLTAVPAVGTVPEQAPVEQVSDKAVGSVSESITQVIDTSDEPKEVESNEATNATQESVESVHEAGEPIETDPVDAGTEQNITHDEDVEMQVDE